MEYGGFERESFESLGNLSHLSRLSYALDNDMDLVQKTRLMIMIDKDYGVSLTISTKEKQ